MEYLFETEHLKVRAFGPSDAPDLYQIHLDEEVKKWFPNESYADIDEAAQAIRFYADCVHHQHLPYVLAVVLKSTGELIGDAGGNQAEEDAGEIEIGYVICKKYRGKGYATELVKAMTVYIAETFAIHTLYGRVMYGNQASARVLEKSGYAFVRQEWTVEDGPSGHQTLVYSKNCGSA